MKTKSFPLITRPSKNNFLIKSKKLDGSLFLFLNIPWPKLFLFVLSLMCLALASSLSIKASIGLGPYDALAKTLSLITPFKVGFYYNSLNLLWLILNLILCKTIWNPKLYSQLLLIFGFGFMVDLIYYDVFQYLVVNSYPLRWALLVCAIALAAFGAALLLNLDFISPPMESFCMELTTRLQKNFGTWRRYMDFGFVLVSFILTILFHQDWTLREGTIFSALSFGPAIAFFLPITKKVTRAFLSNQ